MKKILVLCTGNSCRSIMAEALLNHYGAGRIAAVSAGSRPTGHVHPMSLATLKAHGINAQGYSSKSWDVFQAQPMDIVITVCDNAAGESCPLFLNAPVKAHWGVPDPAHIPGTEAQQQAGFDRVYAMLERRVLALLRLPLETLEKAELAKQLQAIGSTTP
jgi:arsenate reductase